MYTVTAVVPFGIIPIEGIHITAHVLCMSPTSLGVLTPASSKVTDDPGIGPCYFTMEHDRVVICADMRSTAGDGVVNIEENYIGRGGAASHVKH